MNAPSGTWFESLPTGFRVGATTRDESPYFYLPFMAAWCWGTMYIPILQSIESRTPGLHLLLLSPIVLIGLGVLGSMLMRVAGSCSVVVRGDEAVVFVGVGAVGWRRRFKWSQVHAVTDHGKKSFSFFSSTGTQALILVGPNVQLGTALTPERRAFLIETLRDRLAPASGPDVGPYRN